IVLTRNEIELGMVIPTIISRVSKISRDKGNKIRIVFNPRHSDSTSIKIFVECVGAIMGIQVPLMVIDRRGVSIMSTHSRTRRVTHLTFVDARVVMGYILVMRPKVVRSLGWDPGRHEELRNGPEIKFHIRQVVFWVPEKFRIFWKVLEASRMLWN